MRNDSAKLSQEILEYQPDAVEIEERPVPGKIRWVLYLIVLALVATVVGAVVFKVDRIVVAQGRLITSAPTIVVQPLNTAVVRSIDAQVGDIVEKDQVLVTLDPTFASADLSQYSKQQTALSAQIRRIKAELQGRSFSAQPGEGEDGKLQEQILNQRKTILERNRRLTEDKIAALRAKLDQNAVQRQGLEEQLKVLRDVEGTVAKRPQNEADYRIRVLDAQKSRKQAASSLENLKAEEQVTVNEIKQAESDFQRFEQERRGELMEQEVELRKELEKAQEEIRKARRLHELVSLRAPQKAIVLKMAERSVGSIIQQAEPFLTLVPLDSPIEVEVDVQSKDIGRIRTGDAARVKLDAFPFQRHDTLPGKVRVISENSFQRSATAPPEEEGNDDSKAADTFYRTRIALLSSSLRNVPEGFRLMPGMKVRAEIKVGTRSLISYFLYPVIRAFDESMREP